MRIVPGFCVGLESVPLNNARYCTVFDALPNLIWSVMSTSQGITSCPSHHGSRARNHRLCALSDSPSTLHPRNDSEFLYSFVWVEAALWLRLKWCVVIQSPAQLLSSWPWPVIVATSFTWAMFGGTVNEIGEYFLLQVSSNKQPVKRLFIWTGISSFSTSFQVVNSISVKKFNNSS